MKTAPFILQGIDCDGETRELGYSTIEAARKMASDCMHDESSGPAWLAWAIWGNDPITEEWRALETNMRQGDPDSGFIHFFHDGETYVLTVSQLLAWLLNRKVNRFTNKIWGLK